MPYVLNGEALTPGRDVEIDGFAYSYETLLNMAEVDRSGLGVTWAEPEAPSLNDRKAAACAQVRALRWEKHTVVTVNGVEFVSDDTAATRLVAAISARQIAQAMGLEPETATAAWEAKSGAMIPMTLNDQRGLLLAGVAKTQAAFNRQAELIAEINAAETVGALEAIDFSAGWP
jgi:hypothetical protein